ncbi:MAG: metallophosphoesterase [Capsulimonadales bacterium]|nr:metallophosphoesterase [Capsulimonadales bacterium]
MSGVPDTDSEGAKAPRSVSRRRLLRNWGMATAGSGVLGYGALYAPFHPVIERITIPVRGLPPAFAGIRVALLSDLHVQPAFPARHLEPAVELVGRERPDLILLLGDYISDQEPDKLQHMRACATALRSLAAPLGIYAIFGNHDFPVPPDDPISEPWEAVGIRTLCHEVAEVRRGNESLYLVGLRSALSRPVNPAELLSGLPTESARIVLWHEPDRARDAAACGGSLQLSGHTHGGQVVIPGLRPPILPLGGRRYPSGRFEVDGMPLYVTRGVGLLPPMVRINCPPEVTLMTLTPPAP